MRVFVSLAAALAAVVLGACNFFPGDPAQQTLAAENAILGTSIVAVRETATVEFDRMAITLEYAQTAIRTIDQQSTRIAATLLAAGTPFVDTSGITSMPPTPAPFVNGSGANVIAPERSATPVVNAEGSARGSIEIAGPTVEPTFDLSIPRLYDITMSTAVGPDDCPTNPSNSFTTSTGEIYVTARAANLGPTNMVVSRWLLEGAEVVNYDWSPGFEIADACIWFYITPSAVEFTPGSWSVELLLDGAPAAEPVTFTIASAG